MFKQKNRILVLAPHTDDGEFGAGASIAKWIQEGHEVYYIAFSSCQDSLPDGYPKDTLINELENATRVIGIPSDNVIVLDFAVRQFAGVRQNILDQLIKFKKSLNPDIVLMPSQKDLHQDHYTIAMEGLRAFKTNTILCYEVPWNNIEFRNSAFVVLSESDVQKKVEAINCYESQANRFYSKSDYVKAQLRFRGTQIGHEYAEAFDIVRYII